jgi:hypothetical protein
MTVSIKLYEYDLKYESQIKAVKDLDKSDFTKLTHELFIVADEIKFTSELGEIKILKDRNGEFISKNSSGLFSK